MRINRLLRRHQSTAALVVMLWLFGLGGSSIVLTSCFTDDFLLLLFNEQSIGEIERACADLNGCDNGLICLLGTVSKTQPSPEAAPGPAAPSAPNLALEWNLGQGDPRYRLLGRGRGYRLFLNPDRALVVPDDDTRQAVELQLDGASSRAGITVDSPLGSRLNYFLGADPGKWVTDVPTFARATFREVYPGVDLVYYGSGPELEHDFVLAPGADPSRIRFRFTGADRVQLHPDGHIELSLGSRTLRWNRPHLYQQAGSDRREVAGAYRMEASGYVGFRVGTYDRSKPLVIDPVVSYTSYLGGLGTEMLSRVAVDGQGNAYFTGIIKDPGYPAVPGPGATPAGLSRGDVVVTKVTADGSRTLYSSYIGGRGSDTGLGIAVDATGAVYLSGVTNSDNFPTTAGAYSRQYSQGSRPTAVAGDCFVVKLSPEGGALSYATYLGGAGDDACTAITLDWQGNAYVTGYTNSSTWPVTDSALQRTWRGGRGQSRLLQRSDAFVTKLKADGSGLLYSTFFGGSGEEIGLSIAVDSQGSAFVAGGTNSQSGLPWPATAFQRIYGGNTNKGQIHTGDGFVLKLNPTGTALVWGSYIGGLGDDTAYALAVDSQGSVFVAGSANSADFPLTPLVVQRAYGGEGGDPRWVAGDAFVSKIRADGAELLWSTYVGGTRDDRATALALDSDGGVWIAGNTMSSNFVTTQFGSQRNYAGNRAQDFLQTGDAFVSKLDSNGRSLVYSTYLGGSGNDWATGIARDPTGAFFVTGGTSSADLPVTPGALQQAFGAGNIRLYPAADGFLAKITDPPVSTGPNVSVSGVVSAASYTGGGVSPGEIVVITGANIGPANLTTLAVEGGAVSTQLSETRVLFDGVPAPILYASATQTSVIVPFSVAGAATTRMTVEYRGSQSRPQVLPVLLAKPALFTANSSGRGQAAALNEDGTYNSASAPSNTGKIVVLFAAGAGQFNPQPGDGSLVGTPLPQPVLPVAVSIGGVAAEVLYAGAAPGQVAGLFQINARIPAEVPAGESPVVVTVGNASSQAGVTIQVR